MAHSMFVARVGIGGCIIVIEFLPFYVCRLALHMDSFFNVYRFV